jgi:hypothetical protein
VQIALRVKSSPRGALVRCLLERNPREAAAERTGALVTTAMEGVKKLDAFYCRFMPQAIATAFVPLVIFGVVAWAGRCQRHGARGDPARAPSCSSRRSSTAVPPSRAAASRLRFVGPSAGSLSANGHRLDAMDAAECRRLVGSRDPDSNWARRAQAAAGLSQVRARSASTAHTQVSGRARAARPGGSDADRCTARLREQ